MDEVRAPWPSRRPRDGSDADPRGRKPLTRWSLGRLVADAERRARARRVPRAAGRKRALEHDRGVGAEAQVWDAHSLNPRRDCARIHESDVLPNAAERHVCAERLGVERDLATAQLGAEAMTEREYVGSTGADPQPNDAWFARRGKAARAVELDVERGDVARRGLGCGGHVIEPIVGSLTEERERDVHQLRLHAAQRGKIRDRAERRLGDLGGEWERDEEPYPRRLEPCGVSLVSDE
jgi:hypothetical protein